MEIVKKLSKEESDIIIGSRDMGSVSSFIYKCANQISPGETIEISVKGTSIASMRSTVWKLRSIKKIPKEIRLFIENPKNPESGKVWISRLVAISSGSKTK